jgi:hypothetical protein
MAGALMRIPWARMGAGWIFVTGGLLGAGMIACGLMDRALARYPLALSHWLGLSGLLQTGIPQYTLTWALICVGIFWWAAVCTFALRPGWGWMLILAAGVSSLALAPAGTPVALLAILIAAATQWRRGTSSS